MFDVTGVIVGRVVRVNVVAVVRVAAVGCLIGANPWGGRTDIRVIPFWRLWRPTLATSGPRCIWKAMPTTTLDLPPPRWSLPGVFGWSPHGGLDPTPDESTIFLHFGPILRYVCLGQCIGSNESYAVGCGLVNADKDRRARYGCYLLAAGLIACRGDRLRGHLSATGRSAMWTIGHLEF